VSVRRVWTARFGRDRLLGRTIDYATFYLAAAWRLWRLARPGDTVVAKTDPPMLSVVAAPVCWLRGARLVNWLQDIFPETAHALGVGGRATGAVYPLLRWLRNWSLRAAHTNVAVGERMAERLGRLGIPANRVRVAANWADGALIRPVPRADNPLRTQWGLADAFVIGYSGNLGRAHDIDTVLEAMMLVGRAAATQSGSQPVAWLFIGGGALFERLRTEVGRRGLATVHFKPYQPAELLAQSLSAADVHLVSLRPELEGLIVPSKFYGICAAGRPSIFIGDRDGEIARLISRYDCGRTLAVGDGAGLARTVLDLAADPTLARRMGERARQALEQEFDRAVAHARWRAILLDGLVEGGGQVPRLGAGEAAPLQASGG
jgi:glycosyltransferase involved in cell wall biosynthesis